MGLKLVINCQERKTHFYSSNIMGKRVELRETKSLQFLNIRLNIYTHFEVCAFNILIYFEREVQYTDNIYEGYHEGFDNRFTERLRKGAQTTIYPNVAIQKKSTVCSPQAKHTNRATATSLRNLVPTFADRRVLRSQRGGSPTAVNLNSLDRSRYFLFKVAPPFSSQARSGPGYRPTAMPKNW
jgi:hypothetical protein